MDIEKRNNTAAVTESGELKMPRYVRRVWNTLPEDTKDAVRDSLKKIGEKRKEVEDMNKETKTGRFLTYAVGTFLGLFDGVLAYETIANILVKSPAAAPAYIDTGMVTMFLFITIVLYKNTEYSMAKKELAQERKKLRELALSAKRE